MNRLRLPEGMTKRDAAIMAVLDLMSFVLLLATVTALIVGDGNELAQWFAIIALLLQVASQGRVNAILGRRTKR